MNKYNIKKPKKKIYIGMIIGLILIALLSLPVWKIQKITVVNNGYYSKEEVINVSGLEGGNLLDLSFNKAKKGLLALPYIQEVNITYHFPGNVTIDLVENAPFMYVPFSGSYLCLNEQGQVIEQTSNLSVAIPVVDGLSFSEFKIGEMLGIQNDDAFLAVRDMINVLKEYEYVDKVKEIDVYNLEEIHLYVDNLDVIMGEIGDFDKKLQWLIATHETYDMGILDLSQVVKSGQASLRPIT
nr:FtsQ-type POTRA domain-containing protein [uncultured Cellulosilyticum sp.]